MTDNKLLTKLDFATLMYKLGESVYDFHERFGIDEVLLDDSMSDEELYNNIYNTERRIFRQFEELSEVSRALGMEDWVNVREEIVDNLYVAMGIAMTTGTLLGDNIYHVMDKNGKKTPENYIMRYYKSATEEKTN